MFLLKGTSRLPSATGLLSRLATRQLFRFESTAPVDASSQIVAPVTGSIWLENIFPVKIGRFDPRHYWIKRYATALRREAKNSILPELDTFPGKFTYQSSVANVKEGGVLLHFKYEGGPLTEAFEVIKKHIDAKGLRSSFNFAKINPYLVKGDPFVEDIQSSVPTNRVRIEFTGPALSSQALFEEFRPFGKIEDITIIPPSGKEVKSVAHIQFTRIRSATAARTCLQNRKVGSSMMAIEYEPIPILLAILAAVSIVVFDPLRIFFITNEVTHRFSVREAVVDGIAHVISYLKEVLYGGRYLKDKDTPDEGFGEFEVHKANLTAILKETPQTFILISGPDGAGKSQLVRKTLESMPYKLRIDCNELVTQRDHIVLGNLARQIGYFPIITWFVAAGSFIDTLITASTGAKAGIASTNEEQIRRMLELVTISLNKITSKQRLARQTSISETKEAELSGHGNYSDSGIEKGIKEAQDLSTTPEVDYPVIVIDEFLSKEKARNSYIYDVITEWAAVLADNQIAHVVFISNNSAAQKRLGKLIPNKTVETLLLADAKFESAQAYVRRRLRVVFSPPELDKCIEAIGGRLTDLELLVQKIQATSQSAHVLTFSEVISRSFSDIVNRSINEIRKVGLREDATILAKDAVEWSPVQFWKIVQLLSKYDEISYDDLRYHALFKGEESAIQAIERAGLITVGLQNGRSFTIKAGKPIYKVAFSQLVADTKLSAILGIQTTKFLVKDEESKIVKYEQEMSTLSQALAAGTKDSLSRSAKRDIESRLDFLAKQIGESQAKITKWDNEEKSWKKNLQLAD
ncbi:RNA12 protein-domain-containing protein [Chytridium lagenaria]|nr:RNA12 protein-domain-containing protein [Chytridium lagenaria]